MNGGRIQIHRGWSRPAQERIALFSQAPTGNVADAAGPGVLVLPHQIKPLVPGSRAVGPALTISTRGGDNLAPWLAIDAAQPGDVIVIATDDHRGSSTFGDLYAIAARNRGVAGIVTDGLCRDAGGIREHGVPAFVAGQMPNAPEKRGPGAISGTIRCGGVVIHAGDVVVADDDGVVIVPQGRIEDVIERLQGVQIKEQRVANELAAGQVLPGWVAEYADAAGREIVDS